MSPFTQSREGAAPYRVLYGDRDADFAAFLQERLEREDGRLDVETTGAVEDLLVAAEGETDCIVLGSRLDGASPVSVLKSIRERDGDIPVVLFTSRGTESLASEAISAGVTDYIVRESGSEQYQVLSRRLLSVAESYRTEQQAAAANRRLDQVYERIDDGFYAVDDEWRVTYWNERMVERTDVPAEEVVGDVVWDHFPEMVDSEAYERYHEAMTTQEPVTFETYIEPLEYWTEVRVFPDESGLSIYSQEITERKTQERQVAELKDRLDLAIRGANLGVWDWNIQTDDVSFNEQWATMLGFSLDEIDQSLETWENRVHPEDMPRVEEQLQAHLDGETERYDCEHRVQTKSGEYKWVRDVGEVVERDADGEPVRAVGIHIDVTEQRESQDRLNASRQRLRQIIDALPQQVFLKDDDGTYLLANEAAADVYGVDPIELEGATHEAYGKESDHRDFRADDREVIETGEPKTIPEDTFVDAGGNERVVRTEIQPIATPDSEQRQALVISTDITRRTEIERELQSTKDRLERLIEGSPIPIMAVDPDGIVTLWNDAAESVFGWDTGDVLGEYNPLVPDEKRDEHERLRSQVLDGEVISGRDVRRQTSDGDEIDLSLSAAPIRDESGDVFDIVAFLENISERKERERALRQFKKAVESAGHAIIVTDADETIEYVNPAFEELTGYDAAEAIGKTPRILRSPATSDEYYEKMWTRLHDGEVWHEEIENRRKSGEPYYADQTITPIEADDGESSGFVAIQRDITERKRFEQRLRALHEADRELTVTESVEEIAATATDAAADVLDLPISCVWRYDEAAEALVPVADSEDARAVVGPPPTFEPGNSVAWEAYDSGEMFVFEDIREAERAYDETTPLRSELIVPLGSYGVMSVSSTEVGAFDDIDIDLFQILASAVEAAMIQADREATLRERERELTRQNERLDDFTSVVAHDLRNPLSIAVGMLDLARETGDDEHFQKADDALVRMDELIDDLLTLARHGDTVESTTPVSLATMARESWRYVDTDDADLVVETEPETTVDADANRLTQLLENLFRNAVEHGGERVTVRVGRLEDGFYVEDTGEGIPEDDREAVFDYGFTTNEDGTGFGLSIVADIARAHGWEHRVAESEAGGARFEFVATG